jgi:hypothetical protein
MIHEVWGEKLKNAFMDIPEPNWNGSRRGKTIISTTKRLGPVPIHRAKVKSGQNKKTK